MNFQFHVRRITVSEECDVYQLLGNTWNTMVEGIGLEAGTMCVLTKKGVTDSGLMHSTMRVA